MGSTESGDFSVGAIVWVRRRNGSWWPGKIVGPEGLSTSHLTSPRSGTPVKLLGRDDASIDWYNLEKSKRVKPFRCGEFDDCIEKAELSQGIPIKKREKYARREDAILHALELEKQQLKQQGKLGISSERMNRKLSGAFRKELFISSGSLGNEKVKLGNYKSHQFSKRLHMSHTNDIRISPLSFQRAKEGNQLSGEDDHIEVIPRMRGLQEFGLKISPSKRKVSSSVVALNGCSWKPAADGTVQDLAGGLSVGGTSHVNGVEQTGVAYKAKRSKCVYLPTEFGECLEYIRAPSSHMEISDSPAGVHPHAESLTEENTSGFTEDESDPSETDSFQPESDSSETEPDMDEQMHLLSEPEVGRYQARQHGSMVDQVPDELTDSGHMAHLYSHDPLFGNEPVSKWQLKGKRNIRNLSKKSMDATGGKGYLYGPYSEEKTEMFGLDDEYSLPSGASRYRKGGGQNMMDWEDLAWEDRSAWDEYWDLKREPFHPVYDGNHHYRRRPRYLIDVDLKVQASYQKEPVPIVSLMSKLNGKAIIGHPIQIEALEDGSSNTLLSRVDQFGDEAVENNQSAALPHAWRTARRTANVRVPRPHLTSAFDGDEASDYLPLFDEEDRPPFKRVNVGSLTHKGSQIKRNLSHNSRYPTDKKLSRKGEKKVSLSSSQRTRTLSSLPNEQKLSNRPIHQDNINSQRDGLIKPESSGHTVVACIPVKLVFSRLLEKINRPPSKAANDAILLNSERERNP